MSEEIKMEQDLRSFECRKCGLIAVRCSQKSQWSKKSPNGMVFVMSFYCFQCRNGFDIGRPLLPGDDPVFDKWMELNKDVDFDLSPRLIKLAGDMPAKNNGSRM